MVVAGASEDGIQADEHAEERQKDKDALNDPDPGRGEGRTVRRKREGDGLLGAVGS